MGIVLGIIWLIAIVISCVVLIYNKKNPYPFFYLVDYETLIQYMKKEEEFAFTNQLEAGFHYYLYQNNNKIEIQAWYNVFSKFESEKIKGNIYYWDKEEFDSLNNLIESHIKPFDGYILIELIDADDVMLNKFKENHKELDVVSYVEKLNVK